MTVNIGFISQNEDLAELFMNIAKEKKFNAIVELVSLTTAEKIAVKMQEKLDVILSRGGTAECIKKVVNIPVVSIPVTAIDILRSIHKAKKHSSNMIQNYK